MSKTGLIQRLENEKKQYILRLPIKIEPAKMEDIDDYIYGDHHRQSEK